MRMPRRALLWLAGVVAIAIVAALTYVALFTAVLSARTVRVLGAHRLSNRDILQAARVDSTRPLLRLSTSAIGERVEQLPEVRTAHVSRSLPATVTITVVERVPAAFHRVGPGRFQYVDEDGHSFGSLTKSPAKLAELVPAPDQAHDVATLSALATVAAAIPQAMRTKIELISASRIDSVHLILRDKRVVEWGSSDRNADKAAVLAALLRRPGQLFDLSNPDLVVTR